jgi:hypothetical protein
MKLTIALLSIIVALGFSACSTVPSKEVMLTPCCASGEPEKLVLLQDSWAPDGRVVRLAH